MLFEVAVSAAVAAIDAARDARDGAKAQFGRVARSDRLWVWATARWGDRFVATVAPAVFARTAV